MNRRGHLSTKIPNAKNRPAPLPDRRKKEKDRGREKSPLNAMDMEMLDRAWAGAEEQGPSSSSLRRSSSPWRGFVMTFTGVENKARLAEMAKNLGAVVEAALTKDVTHVIASGFSSPKYLYAVEHRIPVLTPSWIQVAHDRYLQGEEWDEDELSQSHRLLPFVGLKIAMSGIEPVDKRKTLIRYIEEYGGEYSKDLDRSCTHLIAAKYTAERGQSEKVKWALKELATREMATKGGKEVEGEDLKIIYEEWIWDCVGYEGRWEEDKYDAKRTRRTGKVKPEEMESGVWPSRAPPPVLAVDEAAAAADSEPAMVKKRKRGDLDSLVGDIVSSTGVKTEPGIGRGIKVEATRTDLLAPDSEVGSSSRSPSADPDVGRTARSRGAGTGRKPSMLHISRTASFGGTVVKTESSEMSLPPTHGPAVVTSVIREDGNSLPQIFAGMRIGHAIDEDCEGLERALIVHGASFVTAEERDTGAAVDYLIVRLTSPTRLDMSHLPNPPQIVTECWIEGCCFEKRILPLDGHVVFKPLSVDVPIPGIEKLSIHLSSLSIENAVFMKRLVRALGGDLSLKMNRHTTHLVSGVSSSPKVEKAREWGIKVVRDSWLVAMAQSGRLEDEVPHQWDGQAGDGDIKMKTSNGSLGTPQALISASSQSSRALKPTPTHIDDLPSDQPPTISPIPAFSPPKASTHRLLHSVASLRSSPRQESAGKDKSESSDSKLSRTSSAPPANIAKGKEARVTAHLNPARKEEMTALLAQLTDRGSSPVDGVPSAAVSKPIRRRPTSRLKSTTNPFASFHTSPNSTASISFDAPGGAEVEVEEGGDIMMEQEPGQESMRVYHRDIVAEKADKKLRDALLKRPAGSDSPAKRLRTGGR